MCQPVFCTCHIYLIPLTTLLDGDCYCSHFAEVETEAQPAGVGQGEQSPHPCSCIPLQLPRLKAGKLHPTGCSEPACPKQLVTVSCLPRSSEDKGHQQSQGQSSASCSAFCPAQNTTSPWPEPSPQGIVFLLLVFSLLWLRKIIAALAPCLPVCGSQEGWLSPGHPS